MNTWKPLTTLRDAARNSPWIVMAVALHLILIAIATVFYTTRGTEAPDLSAFVCDLAPPKPIQEIVDPPEPIRPREVIPHQQSVELVEVQTYQPDLAPTAPAEIPQGEIDAPDDLPPALASTSTAIGVGVHGVRGVGPSPWSIRNPFPPGRGDPNGTRELRPTSSVPENGVLSGLRWLARHQNEDGSWSATALADRCDPDHACDVSKASRIGTYDEGLTSLALLAFLGAGFSHESKPWFKDRERNDKKVVTGEVVRRGLKWLVDHQNSDGSFGKDRVFLYNHALATMALSEAYGLTQARYWHDPAQRAATFLAQAQRPNPSGVGLWGWRYAPRQEIERFRGSDSIDENFKKELFDADTSVTGWAVMALKSARMAGLEVPEENFAGALAFARWVSREDGLCGYVDPKGAGAKVTGPDDQFDYHPAGMSALSMCIRAFAAHDLDDPFLEPAAKRLVADLPSVSKDKLSVDYYYWYYASLALFQFDGPDSPRARGNVWTPWNKAMQKAVLDLQERGKGCGEGGWLVPDRWSHSGGPIYATALNVLTLEVYYRYANAFLVSRKRTGSALPPPQGAK